MSDGVVTQGYHAVCTVHDMISRSRGPPRAYLAPVASAHCLDLLFQVFLPQVLVRLLADAQLHCNDLLP